MKAETAFGLISGLILESGLPQWWADLGSGEGTFTKVLARLLPSDSQIFALDQSSSSLQKIPAMVDEVNIKTLTADFMDIPNELPQLDGILMANALHYVRHKESFLRKWIGRCKSEASFLIIEYDTDKSNSWVPYPVKPLALKELFADLGFKHFEKLGEIPSLYHNKIYATQIRP